MIPLVMMMIVFFGGGIEVLNRGIQVTESQHPNY